ncbi:hypothetical protein ILUMI_13604 [Ignelater luminosus]|uniref:CAF1B/HIR1 beta-propeller domain-containing protein n=1 Tax=Ignelater luminosus TaxID=2038154 RepID=A0A8K0G8I2_IGNLU|nr:hypothetical protein ILUMI_13604 [Ignelater luminosus]
MKCTIPEISWHNRDPVLSVDIQPSENEEFYRLASGGYDCHILIWYLKIQQNGAVNQEMVSDLSRHQRAVNVVRWSPSGQYLASGDDDANIIIWTLKTDNIPLLEGETSDKETWLVHKILRGHKEDVYDICWSSNGMKLISGSIDNTAILWDFTKGSNECILSDHKGFVQGVTWDPKGQYIATLSSDRVCRIFDNSGKRVVSRTHKGILPLPESHVLYNKEVKYFHDDTFKSYFRRLSFSPDGNLLITPSGCIEHEEYKAVRHTTLIFTLDCLTQPAAILPSPKQVTIAVRCCPMIFELHSDGTNPLITLPYRVVIAVATDTDVILYDTQQRTPFAHFQKIHYTRITDLTWSPDGLLLIASSTDGYCTMVAFEPGELGVQYVKEESETEESVLDISGCEEIDKNNSISSKNKEKDQVDTKLKKPNILEKWTVRKPKIDLIEENENKKDDSSIKPPPTNEEPTDIDRKTPELKKNDPPKPTLKRIAPIKIGEIEHKKKANTSDVEKVQKVQDDVITENQVENKEEIVDLTNDDSVNSVEMKQNRSTPSKINKENNKEQQSNTPPSKKRKVDKKNPKDITNSPLLRFFQPIKPGNEKSALNKSVSKHSVNNKVIEISDDECCKKNNWEI